MTLERWRRMLPGLWAGWLLCVALLATPAPFATLASADAGRVAGRMLAQEAYSSVVLALILLLLERTAERRGGGRPFGLNFGLALGALFCTVAGYFGVQPLMTAARAGQGPFGFGALHAASVAFFAAKIALVLWLGWRAAAR